MAAPTNREEFTRYCLRKLGAPVIQINLSDEQINDRVDEAIYFWNEYHYNGAEMVYLRHELTQVDVDRGYIEVPTNLTGVVRIFGLNSGIAGGSGIFNMEYQFMLNNVHDLSNYNLQNYWMTMQNLRFLQEWLIGLPMIRFNRHVNKVHIDMSKSKLHVGSYVIVEAYEPIDESNADMWSDRWLQNYATVLIKEAWGSVLKKFTNMQLVGGIQFSGDQIYQEASSERMRMEEDAIQHLQPIVMNFMG